MLSPRKTAILSLASLAFAIAQPSTSDAGDRELCIYSEFDQPKILDGLVVQVEKFSGRVSGNFLVNFYADGHVFGAEWMYSRYDAAWGLYIASKMFYWRAGERYRVDLFVHHTLGWAYLRVQREYLMNFMGFQYWATLSYEGPLIDRWVQIHPRGCNRGT